MIAAQGSIAQGAFKLRALFIRSLIRYIFFIYTEKLREVQYRSMTGYV